MAMAERECVRASAIKTPESLCDYIVYPATVRRVVLLVDDAYVAATMQ